MSKSEVLMKYGIDVSFKTAVLRREDIKRTYIVLDNIMYNYNMERYVELAKKRIFDMEGINYLLDHEHINYNILDGLMQLDEVAFLSCGNIIKGYVKESSYQKCLELIRAKEDAVRICNIMIKFYRSKSLRDAIKEYFKYKTMKSIDEEKRELNQVILECYRLELASRFPLVKLYYRLYYWSCKKVASVWSDKLTKKIQLEESR